MCVSVVVLCVRVLCACVCLRFVYASVHYMCISGTWMYTHLYVCMHVCK